MKINFLIVGAWFAFSCGIIQAQIPITTNMLPPAVGLYDQYYLPGPVDEATNAMTLTGNDNAGSGDNDQLTYVALDRESKGQSFTTGPNPSGYTIGSVTLRHILWTNFLSNGTFMNVPNGTSLDFAFGTMSGTTLTPMLTTNAVYSGTALGMAGGSGTGIYFTFDLSGAGISTLSPNTTYYFEVAAPATAYFELHNTRTNATSYSGGTAFYGDTVASLDQSGLANLPPYGGEFAFVARLQPVGAPTVVAETAPSSGTSGQTFTITATVTPGLGTVTNVVADLSAIGGSSSARLVLSTGNVFTNTFAVPNGAPLGVANLKVTVTDTTPLSAVTGAAFTVLPSAYVWDGGSPADDKWSSSANWLGDLAPALSGNSVIFAGSARPTPDMDANYGVAGVTFSNTAGSFNIHSSTGSTLTSGSGGIVNNSASAQILNVPVTMSAAQAFNTAAGNLTLSNSLTGGFALTKAGPGTLAFSGAGASSLGDLTVNSGTVKLNAGTVRVSATQGNTKIDGGSSVEVAGGAVLNITNGANAWFPVGDTAGTTNTLTVSGGSIIVNDNWGIEVPRQGSAVLNINSGSMTINDIGGIGLILGDQATAENSTVNLNGGSLIVNRIAANNGTSAFYFNGGMLQPVGSSATFFPDSTSLSVYVRNNGAIIDTAGNNITIGEPLLHSTVSGDNATDGGLTKKGAGILSLTALDYNGYNGPTKVLSGALGLTTQTGVPSTGGDLIISNATLNLDASSSLALPAGNVVVENGSTLNLSNYQYGNSITGSGNLSLSGGNTININYGLIYGNPTMAAITMTGTFSASGTNVINIAGTGFVVGQFPLIDYSGTSVPTNNFVMGSLPPGVNAVLVNNTANTSLDLAITLVGNNLSWHGATADNSMLLTNWDINTSANWYDINYVLTKYMQYAGNAYGDSVKFGDDAYNLDGTNSVNLAARVVPATVTIDSATPYRLTGSGGIDGSTAVVMNYGSCLMGTSNNYTGGTVINFGTMTINSDSALGASSGVLTLAGGALQVAGNMANARLTKFTTNSTVDVLSGVSARLQLTGSSAGTGGMTKTGGGSLTLLGTGSGTNALGDFTINGGNVTISSGTVGVRATQGNTKIDAGSSVEIASGATLSVTNGVNAWFPVSDTPGTTNLLTISGGTLNVSNNWGIEIPRQGSAVLTINSGGMTVNDIGGIGLIIGDQSGAQNGTINLNGGTLVANRITANNGANVFYFNGGTLKPIGANANFFPNSATLSAYVRNGGAVVDTGGLNVSIGQPLGHSPLAGDNAVDGGLTKTGSGTLTLNASNSYSGPTVINGGTLGGNGILGGALTNNATLAPGNNAIGRLTVNGNIILSAGSTNTFEVNGSTLTNDAVVAGGSVAYGGTLNVVPTGTFSVGQHFQLFSGSGATNSGNFANIFGSPGSGLAFSFTNGVLSVVTGSTGPAGPEFLTNSYSAGVLSLSWPAGQGWRLQMQTNAVSEGLGTNWVYVTAGSVNSTNITVDSSMPTVFYRLAYP